MDMTKSFTLVFCRSRLRAITALVNANVEQKLTLSDPIENITDLLENGFSMNRSDFFPMLFNPTREEELLLGHVDPKELELQVEDTDHVRTGT